MGFKHNLKYGPRSKLRRACSRFLRFAYLLDFVAMDALTNIYVKSVLETLDRLDKLADAGISMDKYELKSNASNVIGGGAAKGMISSKYAPFFALTAKFLGNEMPVIPKEHLITEKILRFETAFGQESPADTFNPTVHIELKEDEVDEDDEDAPVLTEEQEFEARHVKRTRVQDIDKLWLAVEPSQARYTQLLNECFQEGLECLKNFERWAKHERLSVYVNVLESWDDKVTEGDWESPDDPKLDCDEWL